MPAYFYHLRLEVLPNSHSSKASSLAPVSAWEALLPFQKRSRPSNSSPPSGAASDSQSNSQASSKELTLERRPKQAGGSSIEYTPPQRHPLNPTLSYNPTRTTKDVQTDIRSGAIVIECIDMVAPEYDPSKRTPKRGSVPNAGDNLVAAGIGTDILGGLRTKGRYIPLDQEIADSVFGIVHLYRDAQESPYLAGNDDDYLTYLKGSAAAARQPGDQRAGLQPLMSGAGMGQARGRGMETAYPVSVTASTSVMEEDCTTLCILAVPSYLSPSDFLGFVGEKTRDCVSHFRMIRTPRANRYMVLLKFRSGRRAKEWQKEWNGKVFNSMEVCLYLESMKLRA